MAMQNTTYYITGDPGGLYTAPAYIEGGSADDRVKLVESDCSVIYDVYDRLAADFPQFVTSSVLGEVSGYELKHYRIAYPEMENRTDFPLKRPKLVMTSAIHGYEQGCARSLAYFFDQMLRCENPLLRFLLRSAVFEVVPVANPWGFSHNDRRNANGIDINRNFDANFVDTKNPENEYYGGKTAASEAETRILSAFLESNTDAEYVIDCHNIANGCPLFYVQNEKPLTLASSVFTALSDKWTAEYPELERDRVYGYVRKSSGDGMYSGYAAKLGLNVFTLETPWCMPVVGKKQYDRVTIRCGLEVQANTVLAIVRSLRAIPHIE